jgi:ABC-2 type transport system ATP-binding protein
VECRQVSKTFGNVQAIKDVSFAVEKGKIHALLGHNGAGKTTALRAIMGLLKTDSGKITVLGKEYL